jgi:predicted Zn-dependent protease with MMP-like domain
MRLGRGRQRPDHRRRVGVDERQGRDRIVRTPGSAAPTGNVHVGEAIAQDRLQVPDTRTAEGEDLQPLRSPVRSTAVAEKRGSRRREMRGPLLPPTVPGWRSRAERFDMAVLEAYEPIEQRWQERVSALDVAVDEIPRIAPKDPDSIQWPPEVVADGPIALARLIPAGVDIRGNATRARIVLFRKPIERRAKDTDELAELLHELLVAQVATYLGVEPSVIDPTIDDD